MKHQIELRHITYFLAVAEALHFRKAAERLFISQPGLSRQIKYLETELGVVLFERHSRKVVLTKAGQFLKAEFTAHLNSLQHSIDNAKLLQDGKKGMLRVGYVGSAMQNVIPELLVKFKNKQPGIVFNLKELDNKTQLDNLQAFTLDVGFVRLERVPPGLVLKPILKENFLLGTT
jgi:transcriptional regulator, LysR family